MNRTTVTAVADEAGVSLSALYRHFGSRDELIQQALAAPLAEFLQRWRDAQPQTRQAASDLDVVRVFVTTIYHAAKEHRGLIQTLLVELAGAQELLTPLVVDIATELETIGHRHTSQRGIDDAVIPAGVRAVITLTLAAALIGPAFLATGTEDQLIDSLARFSAYGIRQTPQPDPAEATDNRQPVDVTNQQGVTSRDCDLHRDQEHDG